MTRPPTVSGADRKQAVLMLHRHLRPGYDYLLDITLLPLWRELAADAPVLAIFTGADSYVSPAWYPARREHGKVVPTWNYATVHVSGNIRRDELRKQITSVLMAGDGVPNSVVTWDGDLTPRC